MGMVVRTNINALNAGRHLGKNNKTNSRSLEKLASGFKINRAGDDASGLAISEKMKAQIKALGQASANCEDGISLVQTAEGYMSEIHDMLNRMVELAEKSANGINEKSEDPGHKNEAAYGSVVDENNAAVITQKAGTDRAALQAEMDQLCAEIDRIALTANFNGNKLLNGNLDASAETQRVNPERTDLEEGNAGLALQIGETSSPADKLVVSIRRMTTDVVLANMLEPGEFSAADGVGNSEATTIQIANGFTDEKGTIVNANDIKDVGNASAWQKGVTVNISDQACASKAAELIRVSINDVSLQRAQLGATQNRLDYTINNLDTTKENMESANSRIRDTDMAQEMMKYTQTNVLSQAAQAMLAQANTQPQNVLQLLQ